jgi:EAL domain-containing protein (putative c-di-GMP-specific phosphodiesterase class I)
LTPNHRRLLAIDDEQGLLDVVQEIALNTGYDVVCTSDPAYFLQLTREWQPTLVLMDLQMPDVDGVELLRAMAADKLRAPIVLMSGVEDKVLRTVGDLGGDLGLNMRGVLAKPIRLETFRRTLEDYSVPNGVHRADELRGAIANGQLVLHYQPLVRLATRELIAFEALVRWNHPYDGLIQPDFFIPLAEERGMMDDLTWTVMRLAIEQAASWAESMAVPIGVNISATNLNDEAFPDKLSQLCREFGVAPKQISLELTETATSSDAMSLKAILSRIRLKGFRLAIDDFGIGYSSMMQLRSLPFSELKIDKSFVSDMVHSEDAAIIVDAILALAGAFRMDVVAEGIETEAQLTALIRRGALLGQGYLIARPAPADDISRQFDTASRSVTQR